MTTPLIILTILFVPFITFWAIGKMRGDSSQAHYGGVLGLSLAFFFFGIGHFAETRPMAEMLPPFVPYRVPLIYATGLLEFALAIALLVPRTRRLAGWACIAVLILFFPANVYAALNQVGMGGHVWGPVYLLVRVPLQIVLIVWAYIFTVQSETVAVATSEH